MNSLNKIVQNMYGSRRLEETASLADMDTQTYIGIATGDSEEGSVSVWLTDDVTQSDNGIWDGGTWVPADESDTSVVLPTTQSVHKGDRVLVSMFGGNTIATPVVTGVIGGGDSLRQDVDVAQETVDEVSLVANATQQHFWEADNGIHVTQVTKDDFEDNPSGPNLLANSNGLLLQDGSTPLSAFTPSGVALFDGAGSGTENVVGVFSSDGARVGYFGSSNVTITQEGMNFCDSYGHSVGTIASGTTLDTSVVAQYFNPDQMASGQVVTIDFVGTPDFSSGTLDVRVSFYKPQALIATSYTGSVSAYGTVISNSDIVVAASATTDGWRMTITALVDISRFEQAPYFGTHATWYTSAYAPKYEFGGTATGPYALAANKETIASGKYQTVIGRFNAEDTNDAYALIVGNGSSDSARSNAFVVDWNGDVVCGTVNGVDVTSIAPSVSSTTATRGSAASTISVNSVRRYGKVVQVTLGGIKLASALSAGSTSGTVATVPSGYRPTTNVYAAIGSTGAHGGSYARITTAGLVTVRNSSSSSIATSAELCFTVSYVID